MCETCKNYVKSINACKVADGMWIKLPEKKICRRYVENKPVDKNEYESEN